MWKKSPIAVLAVLLRIHVLAQVDRNILLGFATRLEADLSMSNTEYGALIGAVWVLSFGVMAIVMGALADRFSRTRVVAAGLLVWSLCTAASGLAHSYWQLVAARVFVASGEAALVPAAIALLTELFEPRRRGSAIGVFFMGIPLGIGFSFVLAGSVGAAHGWRPTFIGLGMAGALIALGLAGLREPASTRANAAQAGPGSLRAQLGDVFHVLRCSPALRWTIAGLVLVHFAFVGLSFAQIWLVRERGLDAAAITRTLGVVELAFGVLGSLVGGLLGDAYARGRLERYAHFVMALALVCGPLMIAYRFVAPGTPLFYAGMAAGAFLPLAAYGPCNALIQAQVAPHLRATISGVAMMLINVFAITLGNLAVGLCVDRLGAAGVHAALTWSLFATDLLALAAAPCFAWVASCCARPSTGAELQGVTHARV